VLYFGLTISISYSYLKLSYNVHIHQSIIVLNYQFFKMSKPSILFIPGSFSVPDFYDPVFSAVRSKGYELKGLHKPSAGLKSGPREGAPPTMYDDAAYIASEAEKLVDEGKDVILVAHSYGGVPTTESTKGLSKKEREAQGKKGGIVRLAYMTALVPEIGTSAAGILEKVPDDMKLDLKVDVCSPFLPSLLLIRH
jgi:hypothetical protein